MIEKIDKWLFFVVVLVFFSCSNEKNEYYPNGKLKSTVELNHAGENDGLLVEYYESGVVKSKGHWEDGYLEGEVAYYFENGDIKERSFYKNGLLDGVSTFFSKDGVANNTISFRFGLKNGATYFFNDSGSIYEKHLYSNDTLSYVSTIVDDTKFGSLMPIIIEKSDTIKNGDVYSFRVKFGIPLKGEITIIVGKDLDNMVVRDTIGILDISNDYQLEITNYDLGENSFALLVKHADERDTLSADGVGLKHSFFVEQ